jgi:hypothetical protein
MKLSFVRVQTWDQALDLLEVRNACRDGMTHTLDEITVEQQRRFYEEHLVPGHVYDCYVWYDEQTPIGFGVIKKDGHRAWMTHGLIPEVRGRHLSRIGIQFITQMGYTVADEVWIDVWDWNHALRGDIREGYEFVTSTVESNGETLHVMRHRRDRIFGEDERLRLARRSVADEMRAVDEISRATLSH